MLRTFLQIHQFETMIEMPFKAICPIPTPPRMYYGKVRLRYHANVTLDFNEVYEDLKMFCDTGNRSAEDLVEWGIKLVETYVGGSVRVLVVCEVDIPEQQGHLHVTLQASNDEPLSDD